MDFTYQKEINELAIQLIELRTNFENDPASPALETIYTNHLNKCMPKFLRLVDSRLSRYRKFSNFEDLKQEGYEAVMMALKTYKPSKGEFSWWAGEYIKTKISRAANNHSAIKYPIDGIFKPYKLFIMPQVIDTNKSPYDSTHDNEISECVLAAVSALPDGHKKVINLIYGLGGISSPHTIEATAEITNLSRSQCLKVLKEAKNKLKQNLAR